MTCHRCQREAFKFGFHKGFQRFRCKTCGKTFCDTERPLGLLRVEPEKAHQIVHLLCEGVGIRAIERLMQLNRRTVLNVLEVAGRKCEQLLDEKIRGIKVKDVQIDETYSFVNCLQDSTTPNDLLRGDQYAFLGVERGSKLIIHYHIGKRDRENPDAFLTGLRSKIDGRFQLTSDEFHPYSSGELNGVFRAFRDSVDYGTETKCFGALRKRGTGPRRENRSQLLWMRRTARIGNPNRALMTINHVERTNLSVRLFNRRFTRKTLGYSKTLRNHKFSVAIMVAFFNFCRVHSAHKKTPAMAAGLADRVWKIGDLLA